MTDDVRRSVEYARANGKRILRAVSATQVSTHLGSRLLKSVRQSGREAPLQALAAIYQAADEYTQIVARFVPCRRGCCHCCRYVVTVSEIEVAFIEHKEGVRSQSRVPPLAMTHGLPCPFLLAGECAIYESRPFMCRRYFTLDQTPYWCEPTRCNTAELTQVQAKYVSEAYALLVGPPDRERFPDIRNVFPQGLNGPRLPPSEESPPAALT